MLPFICYLLGILVSDHHLYFLDFFKMFHPQGSGQSVLEFFVKFGSKYSDFYFSYFSEEMPKAWNKIILKFVLGDISFMTLILGSTQQFLKHVAILTKHVCNLLKDLWNYYSNYWHTSCKWRYQRFLVLYFIETITRSVHGLYAWLTK